MAVARSLTRLPRSTSGRDLLAEADAFARTASAYDAASTAKFAAGKYGAALGDVARAMHAHVRANYRMAAVYAKVGFGDSALRASHGFAPDGVGLSLPYALGGSGVAYGAPPAAPAASSAYVAAPPIAAGGGGGGYGSYGGGEGSGSRVVQTAI